MSRAHLLYQLDNVGRTRRRRLWFGVSAAATGTLAAAGLAAGTIDFLLPLPGWTRAVFLAVTLWLVYRSVRTRANLLQFRPPESIAARIEAAFPALEDRLITAAEVAAGSLAPPKLVGEQLISAGAKFFQRMPLHRAVDRETSAVRIAPWLVPAGLVILLGAVSPEGVVRHAGRLFFPGARIAPMTATRLFVSPGDAKFPRGSDVEIVLETRGVIPGEAWLKIHWPDGTREEKAMNWTGDGIFKAFVAEPADGFRYRAAAGDAVSFEYAMDIISPPLMVDPRVTITPPAYTGIAPSHGPPGPISAVVGTAVRLAGRTEPEAISADVILRADDRKDTAETVVAAEVDDGEISARFDIRRTGDWAIRLAGEDAPPSAPRERWPVEAISDKKPVVRIRRPNRDARVTPVAEIPIVGEASDDFGLARLKLLVGWDSSPERVFGEVVLSDRQTKETSAAFILALEHLRVEPGDILACRFEAADANDVTGPGIATSDVRFVEVVPFDAYYIWAGESEGDGIAIGSIRRLIEMEKGVIRKTAADLVGASVPPESFERVREQQKNARDETIAMLEKIDESLAQDGIGGAEKIQVALADASGHMAQAEKYLSGRQTPAALGQEREAVRALNRAIQAILFEIRRSRRSRPNEYNPSGPVADLPDMPKSKDAARHAGDRPAAGSDAAMEETRNLAEKAQAAAESAKRRAEAAAKSGEPAGRLTDLQREEIESLAGRIDRLAAEEEMRPGQPAVRAANRLIRRAAEAAQKTYAPSGPIAEMLGEVARLLIEARDAQLDALRRRDIPAEDSPKEPVPEEYQDLVRDYFRRLGS